MPRSGRASGPGAADGALWAVDVGNTRVKAGRFGAGGRLLEVRRGAPDDPTLALDGPAVVLSVSAPAARVLLGRLGPAARLLGRDLPLLVENRTLRPEEVGHDRLANAVAAHARAGGAAVVADVGTAITVDAVAADGAFLGGTIAPGPEAALAGLRSRAPHLPDPGDADPADALGRTTRDAMAAALRHGFAGLVDRLLEDVAAAGGEPAPRLLLTGGGAPALAPRLRAPVELVPDLTLEGIRLLALRAGGGPSGPA